MAREAIALAAASDGRFTMQYGDWFCQRRFGEMRSNNSTQKQCALVNVFRLALKCNRSTCTYIVIILDNLNLHTCYLSKGMQLGLAEALVNLRQAHEICRHFGGKV
jgi:hypothetical protein